MGCFWNEILVPFWVEINTSALLFSVLWHLGLLVAITGAFAFYRCFFEGVLKLQKSFVLGHNLESFYFQYFAVFEFREGLNVL